MCLLPPMFRPFSLFALSSIFWGHRIPSLMCTRSLKNLESLNGEGSELCKRMGFESLDWRGPKLLGGRGLELFVVVSKFDRARSNPIIERFKSNPMKSYEMDTDQITIPTRKRHLILSRRQGFSTKVTSNELCHNSDEIHTILSQR